MGSIKVGDADAHRDSVATYSSMLARGNMEYIAERLAYAGSSAAVLRNAKEAIESHIRELSIERQQAALAKILNALMDLEKGYGVVEEQYIRDRIGSFKIYLYTRLGGIMLGHAKLMRGKQGADGKSFGLDYHADSPVHL
ncbi:MAG: hypothetical protein LVQ95_03530 [Candidatus Micrarchaeales archaeon]|nr:hypothetical protein [Candidatus Micrarchaeales archaeon]